MAKSKKRGIGDVGEEIACKYLENKGFLVVERNYLRPWGEIDIVARKGERLYFIEVKTVTREPGRVGDYRPEDNMHGDKIRRLHRAIQTYLLQNKTKELEWQLDLACVYMNMQAKTAKVEMLENIIL